ncbi:MAG: hypothetical protein WKG07_31985 [Hymenobacter sp.]
MRPTDVDQLVMLVAPGAKAVNTYYLDDLTGPELTTATPSVVVLPAAAVTDQLSRQLRRHPRGEVQAQRYLGRLPARYPEPGFGSGNASARVLRYTRSKPAVRRAVSGPGGRAAGRCDALPHQCQADDDEGVQPGRRHAVSDYTARLGQARGDHPLGRHSEYHGHDQGRRRPGKR